MLVRAPVLEPLNAILVRQESTPLLVQAVAQPVELAHIHLEVVPDHVPPAVLVPSKETLDSSHAPVVVQAPMPLVTATVHVQPVLRVDFLAMLLRHAVFALVVHIVKQVPARVLTALQAASSLTQRVDLAVCVPPERTNLTVAQPSAYLVLLDPYQVMALPLAPHVRLVNTP
jgi:hypothetical protein